MKLVIVSGLSGSGKSIALKVFEDLEYYCIDNLPINMLDALTKELISANHDFVAIGIDARNVTSELEFFPEQIKQLKNNNIDCEIIFLEANDAALIKRFSETRRKHPLSNPEIPLNEAVIQERFLLEAISSRADLRIDIRCLPNPHWIPELRALTGFDKAVIDYLGEHQEVEEMFNDIMNFIEKWLPRFEADNRSYLTIAIGCTGGQHRSVYFANRLAKAAKKKHNSVLSRHRELS